MTQHFSFGVALDLLKNGKRVARTGWGGQIDWLYLIVPTLGECQAAVLPPGVTYSQWRFMHTFPWIGVKLPNGFVPWVASQTDMLAEDWMEVS